ncbi:hypothetical protein GQ457_15G018370 [Hibiscus cannabinus]
MYARNDRPGRIRKQQYLANRSRTEATRSIRTQNMSRQTCQKEGRRIVKVKDLKPKRIKDYSEYKFSKRSPALLKELNSRNKVNTVYVRDQKHELTPSRNRYPCDNGYKEVTVPPSRDIVYNQVKQLIGLRHKPITLQDALPRSDSQPRFSAKAGPVVSIRDIPFVILLKQNIGVPS